MPLYASHEVMMLQFISKKADVYDIEVEDNHNFALHAGIFVHNSKDCADAICGALWNASQHAEEFDFEYGDTLDAIIETDNQHIGNEKQQLTLDFEEQLKRALVNISN